jgi:hypothetical protein
LKTKTIVSPNAEKYHNDTGRKCTEQRCKQSHLWLPYIEVPWLATHGIFKMLDLISWEDAAKLERLKREL